MIRATLSFSKKVPAEEQFSSQSYHLSLEQELPESLRQEEVQAQMHETFELVKATVEKELASGNGVKQALPDPGSNHVPIKGSEPATNAQIKFLCDMARQNDISLEELNSKVKELYHVEDVYALSKRDASALITELKQLNRAA